MEKVKYKKGYEKVDFDGEKLISRNPNRYCKDCTNVFHSRKGLYTVDITIIDLIICTLDDYYRYTFDFSNHNKICVGIVHGKQVSKEGIRYPHAHILLKRKDKNT